MLSHEELVLECDVLIRLLEDEKHQINECLGGEIRDEYIVLLEQEIEELKKQRRL